MLFLYPFTYIIYIFINYVKMGIDTIYRINTHLCRLYLYAEFRKTAISSTVSKTFAPFRSTILDTGKFNHITKILQKAILKK